MRTKLLSAGPRRAALAWLSTLWLLTTGIDIARGQSPAVTSFQGHTAAMNSAVYTKDGRYVITGGADQLIKIWDAKTGDPVRTLAGHTGQVLNLAVSPDDAMIVSAGADNALRMWDVPRPDPLRSFADVTMPVRDVAVSPNGQWAVSVGDSMAARLWQLEDASTLLTLAGHTAPTTSAAVRNDNNQFATGDAGGEVRLWNPLDGAPQGLLGAHQGAVRRLIFHPNNQQLITAGDDGQLKIWQLPTPAPRPMAGHTGAVTAIALNSNGTLTMTGSAESVRTFATAAGTLTRELTGAIGPTAAVAISPNNAVAAAAGEAGVIKFWNPTDGADQLTIAGHAAAIHGLAFHPDSSQLASAAADGTVRLWRLPTPPTPLSGHTADLLDLVFSPNGLAAASVSADKTVRAWNPTNGQTLWSQPTGELAATTLAYRADNAQLAVGDAAGDVQFRNAPDGVLQTTLGAHFGGVRALAYHPSGETLATVGEDLSLKTWKLPLPPSLPLAGNAAEVTAVALTQSGAAILTGGADKTIRVYDAGTGQQSRVLSDVVDAVTSLALSRDDALTVAGHAGGAIKLWTTADGLPWQGALPADSPPAADAALPKAPAELQGHDGPVTEVAFGPLGKTLASTGADGTLRLWRTPQAARLLPAETGPITRFVVSPNGQLAAIAGLHQGRPAIFLRNLADGKVVQTLLGHEGAIQAISFASDGKWLASGAADNTARVWNLADPKFPEAHKFIHPSAVTAVALTPDGGQLYSAAGDNVIQCWNLADGTNLRSLAGHGGAVSSLTVRGAALYSAAADSTVRSWNLATGAAIRSLNHGAAVVSLAVDAEGKTIASGGANNQVKLWSAADGAPLATLTGHAGPVIGLRFTADGSRLASLSQGGLWLWETAGRRRLESFALPAGEQRGIGIFGDELVAAAADGSLRAVTPHLQSIIDAHVGGTVALAIAPDGRRAVTSGADKTVKLWDLATGAALATFAGPTDVVRGLDITPDGKHLLGGGLDKIVRVWPLPPPPAAPPATAASIAAEKEWELPAATFRLRVAGTGERVALGGEDHIVRVWDWTRGRELQRFADHTAPISDVEISADGSTVVTGSLDKTARKSVVALTQLALLESAPNDLAYTPDGTRLVVAGAQPELSLWKIEAGPLALAGTLPAADAKREGFVAAPQQALAVHPSGKMLAAVDAHGRTHAWNLADGSLAYSVVPADPPAAGEPSPVAARGGAQFSPDGGKLLLGQGQRLQVVDAATGDLLQAYDEPAPITVVAMAADNLTLAVGRVGAQENAALRKLSLIRSIPAHTGAATALAFHPDGVTLFSGGADHQLKRWNLADGALVANYTGSAEAIASVAVLKDGQRVVAGGLDKQVRLWPLTPVDAAPAEPRPVAEVAPAQTFLFDDAVRGVSPSADNTRLAVCTDSGVVSVRDLATGGELQRFRGSDQPALAVAFSPDSRTVVSGAADNLAHAWTISLVRAVAAEASGPVHDAALANAGAQAVTAGPGGVKHWNLANGSLLRTLSEDAGEALTVAVRGDNQQVVAGGADNKLRYWNLANGELSQSSELPAPARTVRYSADNLKIVTACADDHLRFFNPADGQPTYELTSDKPLSGVTFAADSRTVLTGGEQLRQWLYASPIATRTLNGHGGRVYSATFSQDGRWIASTSADQTVRIWDATTGTQAKSLAGHQGNVYAASFSPNGALLVSCGADKSVRLWDTLGGRQLKQIPVGEESLYSVSFYPDGKRLAAAGLDRKIFVVDALTGAIASTLEKHPDYLYRVTFNRTGTRLLSCGYGGNVIVWNAANGQPVYQESLRRVTNFAAFSPDGDRIVVAGGDGKAYFFDLPAGAK